MSRSSVMLSYGWNKDKVKGVDEFGAMLETLLSGKHGYDCHVTEERVMTHIWMTHR